MTEVVVASPDNNITYVSSYFGEVMGHAAAALPPCNLVLFCDNSATERYMYEQRRARNLEDQTVIVRLSQPQPPPLTVSHIAQMEENRMIWVPCAETWSPRDCVLGFSRYELILRTLQENPFESEFFAWVDLVVEGGKAAAVKNATAPQLPNKIACECRGYIPPAITSRWHRFFAPETKSDEVLSLDWFSGDAGTLRRFCHAVLEKFRNCLSAGFGNFRDSQIAYLVYRDHPEWFDLRFLENSIPDNLAATAAQKAEDWDFLRAVFRSKMTLPASNDPRSAIFHPTINPEIFERFVSTEIMKAAVGSYYVGDETFYGRPGYMPYHLLGYISGLFREKMLLVVGGGGGHGETHHEAALALCTNPANTVLVVGAAAKLPLHRPANFGVAPGDFLLQPEKFWESHIQTAALIFMEVLPPEGNAIPQTRIFFDFLRSRRFPGLVIWNGVYLAAAETMFPKDLSYADWSEYGSYTGTIATWFGGFRKI